MPAPLTIRTARLADLPEWLRMRLALWPFGTAAEFDADIRGWLARPDAVAVVAERAAGGLGGFAEAATRPYADGCRTSPVAYLEGWYVDPDLRGSGVGRALVAAVEAWARARGLAELASDVLLDNDGSQAAHRALGFEEVERVVLYRKSLATDRPA